MHKSTLAAAFVLLLSILTYLPWYDSPAYLFWDENYHIASAQRYLNQVFFMEPHPPLGKLIIAGGEAIFNFNLSDDQFIGVESAQDLPKGFSFAGYRLFPALLASFVAPLVFLIIFQITKSYSASFLTSLCIVFDNALIVHNRGAMLEGPQLFFIALTVYSYLKKMPLLLGISTASAILIKINSIPIAVFMLLMPRELPKSVFSFILTFICIWQIHFSLGKRVIHSLDNNGYFAASEKQKNELKESNPSFTQSLIDNYKFMVKYQKGVPEYEPCKTGENGSSPLFWPFGIKTIQYRWDSNEDLTRYLYLVPNPFGWLLGIVGVIGGLAQSLLRPKNALLIRTFVFLYLFSWLSPLLMDRVFYLYHYFIPLLYSWILLGLVLRDIKWKVIYIITPLILVYIYYSPFTYHLPISDYGIKIRSLIPAWDLRCRNCTPYRPASCGSERNINKKLILQIGDIKSNYVEHGDIEPIQIENGFIIKSPSRIQFSLNKKHLIFSGETKGEDLFKIISDGVEIWRSSSSNNKFNISVNNTSALLLVSKGRGEWSNLKLTSASD